MGDVGKMQLDLFDTEDSIKLRSYMQEHFPYRIFSQFKKDDYEGQAAWICSRLGLESIYDYNKTEIRCHISYAIDYSKPLTIPEYHPFVEVIFPRFTVVRDEAKIIRFE